MTLSLCGLFPNRTSAWTVQLCLHELMLANQDSVKRLQKLIWRMLCHQFCGHWTGNKEGHVVRVLGCHAAVKTWLHAQRPQTMSEDLPVLGVLDRDSQVAGWEGWLHGIVDCSQTSESLCHAANAYLHDDAVQGWLHSQKLQVTQGDLPVVGVLDTDSQVAGLEGRLHGLRM